MLIDISIFDIVHVPNLPLGMVRRGSDVALAEEDSDGPGGEVRVARVVWDVGLSGEELQGGFARETRKLGH